MKRPIVFVASPLSRATAEEDTRYAASATRDSLLRGESPVCPHLLYPAVLEDTAANRKLGMLAGMALVERCDIFAMYVDRGLGRGMRALLNRAKGFGVQVERRRVDVGDDGSELEAEPEPEPLRRNSIDLG